MKLMKQLIHFCTILLLISIIGCGATPVEPIEDIGTWTVFFELESASEVSIQITNRFDTVIRLVDLGELPYGSHEYVWDKRDNNGELVIPGFYFIQLIADGKQIYSIKNWVVWEDKWIHE